MKTEPSSTAVVPDISPPKLDDKMLEKTEDIDNPTTPKETEDNGASNSSDSESGSGSDSESDSSSSDDEEDDEDDDDNGKKTEENVDGISDYERLRLERIARNQEQLRKLGLDEAKLSATTKKKKKPSHRKSTGTTTTPAVTARRQPTREVKGTQINLFSQEQLDLMMSSRAKKKQASKNSFPATKTRCGNCEGCLRQDDCNTCVYCDLRKQGAKTRRCIFKACRRINKNKKGKPTTPKKKTDNNGQDNANSNDDDDDKHSDQCDVCQNGGDLILCDQCPRGFHSHCHVPKIKKIPTEEWLCMDCQPLSGFLVALMPDTTKCVKVKVIEPPPQCMICLKDCTGDSSAKKDKDSINCKACDKHFHLACQNLLSKPKGGAARVWKCQACQTAQAPLLEPYANAAASKPPKKKKALKLFQGEHDDDCYICINGGELVCCDFCPKVFHRACHIPALPCNPTGIWKCCECYASERNRMTRCGECKACLAEDCGDCKYCRDRPKFGGNNKLKKPCVKRECPYQSFAETAVQGKIPGEITHATAAKKTNNKKRRRESAVGDANNNAGDQGKKKQLRKT